LTAIIALIRLPLDPDIRKIDLPDWKERLESGDTVTYIAKETYAYQPILKGSLVNHSLRQSIESAKRESDRASLWSGLRLRAAIIAAGAGVIGIHVLLTASNAALGSPAKAIAVVAAIGALVALASRRLRAPLRSPARG
jgi:hypothetical protein